MIPTALETTMFVRYMKILMVIYGLELKMELADTIAVLKNGKTSTNHQCYTILRF